MEGNNYREFFYLYLLNMQKHRDIGTMFSVKTISSFLSSGINCYLISNITHKGASLVARVHGVTKSQT